MKDVKKAARSLIRREIGQAGKPLNRATMPEVRGLLRGAKTPVQARVKAVKERLASMRSAQAEKVLPKFKRRIELTARKQGRSKSAASWAARAMLKRPDTFVGYAGDLAAATRIGSAAKRANPSLKGLNERTRARAEDIADRYVSKLNVHLLGPGGKKVK